MIDLTLLYCGNIDNIPLDGKYIIPKELYKNTEIINLSEIEVKNSSIRRVEDEYFIKLSISGEMKIKDSITLDDVNYPFSIEIDDNLEEFVEKDENSLDIIEVLWQNIVLEVPLRYTVISDYSKYQGDGWKLVSEEDLVNNNPFNTLLNDEDRSD